MKEGDRSVMACYIRTKHSRDSEREMVCSAPDYAGKVQCRCNAPLTVQGLVGMLRD